MEKASDIISDFFNHPPDAKAQLFITINKKWRDIVLDERLAEHCKIEELEDNAVKISFDHPGWIQTFRMNQRMILKRINALEPDLNISSAHLILKNEKGFMPKKTIPQKNGNETTAIREDFQDIKDDELRSRLLKLKAIVEENNRNS